MGQVQLRPRRKSRAETALGSLTKAQTAANEANERRYGEILGGYGDLRTDVMGQVEQVGNTARQDIMGLGASRGAGVRQQAVSRGFGGMSNTVLPTMLRGNQLQTSRELSSLAERMAGLRGGMLANLGMGKLGFMERREDTGPNTGLWAQLLQMLGQGQGGVGIGGGTPEWWAGRRQGQGQSGLVGPGGRPYDPSQRGIQGAPVGDPVWGRGGAWGPKPGLPRRRLLPMRR